MKTCASPPLARTAGEGAERSEAGEGGPGRITALAVSLGQRPRAVTLFGAPDGYDAAAIGSLVKGQWLHVCRDDGRMARFAAALEFFHPEIEALTFPAWDCLPYDRVSPNGEIVSRRIDTLTRLATAPPDKLVVLTTVNALVQRVPPRWRSSTPGSTR